MVMMHYVCCIIGNALNHVTDACVVILQMKTLLYGIYAICFRPTIVIVVIIISILALLSIITYSLLLFWFLVRFLVIVIIVVIIVIDFVVVAVFIIIAITIIISIICFFVYTVLCCLL